MEERDEFENLDPRLAELMDQLRATPPRNLGAARRARQRFLTELGASPGPDQPRPAYIPPVMHPGVSRNNHHPKEEITMPVSKRRFALTAVAVIILAFVALFGGTAMTVMASQSALPGDALYGVKTSVERTRLSLAGDAANRAQLQMEFAGRRLAEIEALIREGRYQNIQAATQEFEAHVQKALSELDAISSVDPARASSLVTQISEALSRYANALGDLMMDVPEPVREEMQRSIRNLQGGDPARTGRPGSGKAGNDNDGNLNENGNANSNDNANTNANANTNTNANTNINTNTNTNANTNDNTNANTNANTNENHNGNDNDDDDNDNWNDNKNDNDD